MAKEAKRIKVVYETNDYAMFKRLEGNRAVLEGRVLRIMSSIKNVGYVLNPIIVNENYEVVDGQGRLEALKRLNMPVHYIVVEGIGISECISMNNNMVGWKVDDFIRSYAETGNESYKMLVRLMDEYGSDFNLTVISNALMNSRVFAQERVRRGKMTCTEDDYNRAKTVLEYDRNFLPIINSVGGMKDMYYSVIQFCFLSDFVDNEKLINKMFRLQASLKPAAKIEQALECVEDVYNDRNRGERVYIEHEYLKQGRRKAERR